VNKPTAVVIGAGIAGLAMARALAIRGYAVTVFDRSHQAVGASIRNFGMVWPIGQTAGKMYECAMRTRRIWQEIAADGAFHFDACGSLHLACHADEWQVLQELYAQFSAERKVSLWTPGQVQAQTEAVVPGKLLGGLYSEAEGIVDPRQAIAALPGWLKEKYQVNCCWGKCVSYVAGNQVYIGDEESYEADLIVVCSGADFETLYPELFNQLKITKCKLQMMRMAAQPGNWRIGPALCGGLSLIHYKSFATAESLLLLRRRYEQELPEYVRWGIHVMVSQNNAGELIIGDSHEYGLTHDPFDKAFINDHIMTYLRSFAQFKDWTITASWNGVYAKLTNGDGYLFTSPEPGVFVFNGLGGAGMTLSFGLAEEIAAAL
jgi:FAD dependent oxidoreductase TIGR03364